MQNIARQFLRGCAPHAFHAGANAAPGSSYLLVSAAMNALLEINQPGSCEDRMRVRIDKSWKDYGASAIEALEVGAIFAGQAVCDFAVTANSGNLAFLNQNSCIVDDTQI